MRGQRGLRNLYGIQRGTLEQLIGGHEEVERLHL
jgi:hypothetical protein